MDSSILHVMTVDPSFLFSQSMNSMNTYLKDRPTSENIGTALLVLWLIAGMIEDPYLYILSAILTGLLYFAGLFQSIAMKIPIQSYSGSALRRLLIGLWANAMYTSGKGNTRGGPEVINIGVEIEISLVIGTTITAYAILWFISKYADKMDAENFAEMNTFYLMLRGITRGSIILGLLYSVFRRDVITEPYIQILFWAFILDPIFIYMQSFYEETLDTVQLSFGTAKLPISALRDVMVSNSILLLFTIWFGGVGGGGDSELPKSWGLLRTGYIIATAMIFVIATESIRKFNINPLERSPLGNTLNNFKNSLETVNIEEKLGYVIKKEMKIELSKNSSIVIDPNSIIVPINEQTDKMDALIIGKGEALTEIYNDVKSDLIDGLTTATIPKQYMKEIKKHINPRRLDTIDLENLQLPSLDQLVQTVNQLSLHMDDWMKKIRMSLGDIKLSNYGISEMQGTTNVKLPGINVLETKGMTKVEIGSFLNVLETPEMTNVRIGNFMTVIEMPKFTFVNLPFLTVLEINGKGTAVDLLGFKISDGVDATYLDEFRRVMLTQMEKFGQLRHRDLGRILVEKNSTALMNVSWNGEFTPLLAGRKDIVDSPNLLDSANNNVKLLEGKTSLLNTSSINSEFMDFTGLGQKKEKSKQKEKQVIANSEKGRSKVGLFNSVDEELKRAKDEIKGKTKKDDLEIFDADYEIVD